MLSLQHHRRSIVTESRYDALPVSRESSDIQEPAQSCHEEILRLAIIEAEGDLDDAKKTQRKLKNKLSVALEQLAQLKRKHQTAEEARFSNMYDILFSKIPEYGNHRAIPPISYETVEADDQVGLYQIFDCIAEGGFAKVFRAKHESEGTYHAIKRLDKRQFKSIKDLAQLGREIQVLRSEIHDNVTECSDVIHANKHIYLVMDLSFCDLQTYCRKWEAVIGPRFFREVARGILEGLETLHHVGIAHLDLKPENILVSRDLPPYMLSSKHFKICDLGLCVISEVPNEEIKVDTLKGTPGFISPEMVLCSPGSFIEGRHCDMWSLGVLLLELLEGVSKNWFKIYYNQCDERDDEAFAVQIKDELYDIHDCGYDHDSGHDLIRRLLQWGPETRFTAKQALEHPWLTDAGTGLRGVH
jgi:serine/threonine protein kinase